MTMPGFIELKVCKHGSGSMSHQFHTFIFGQAVYRGLGVTASIALDTFWLVVTVVSTSVDKCKQMIQCFLHTLWQGKRHSTNKLTEVDLMQTKSQSNIGFQNVAPFAWICPQCYWVPCSLHVLCLTWFCTEEQDLYTLWPCGQHVGSPGRSFSASQNSPSHQP